MMGGLGEAMASKAPGPADAPPCWPKNSPTGMLALKHTKGLHPNGFDMSVGLIYAWSHLPQATDHCT